MAFSDVVLPLSTRAVIDAMVRLPVVYRRRRQLPIDVCRACWPELLDFPFNRPAGIDALRERWSERGLAVRGGAARRVRGAVSRGRRIIGRLTRSR